MKFAILGGGSWGTALGIHLNRNGNEVKIWEFFEDQAREMQVSRICPYLPEVIIPNEITISHELSDVLSGSDAILVVVPSNKVQVTLLQAQRYIDKQLIIIASKGFSEDTRFLSDIVSEIVPQCDVFCLYGPSLAREFAIGLPAGLVLSGNTIPHELVQALEDDNVRIELSTDMVGAQVGAALKNVVTIFVGIVESLNLGENAKAYVFTKGIEEIQKIGISLGAQKDTFYGLTCVGDLTLKSRNRMLGIEIGKGRKLDDILKENAHVSEGVLAIKHALKLAAKKHTPVPLIQKLNAILFENVSPKEALQTI